MGILGKEESKIYDIDGKQLFCQFCNNDTFNERKAQLNKSVSTFFGFDWADRSATCLVCSKCGYIHWFLQ
jgi:hypothetical protein